ncbi:MAG: hypothetical protein IKJ16_07190 [Agathobacter sp.]|nr:hypothetical protein [Agathobacter sp.]
MKTAYIELNTSNHISSILARKEKPPFSYKGIVFYPNTSVTSLSELLHKDYACFILDMGVLTTQSVAEFLRFDKPFLVCSPGKWRRSQSIEQLEKLFKNFHHQHCTVIVNLCEKESNYAPLLKTCEHIPFPFLQNPFQLDLKRTYATLQRLGF